MMVVGGLHLLAWKCFKYVIVYMTATFHSDIYFPITETYYMFMLCYQTFVLARLRTTWSLNLFQVRLLVISQKKQMSELILFIERGGTVDLCLVIHQVLQ